MKAANVHLGNTGKGLMIDDPETVAVITELAGELGISKRDTVLWALKGLRQSMIGKLDVVALKQPLHGFEVGTRGTVLFLYPDACEIEFEGEANAMTYAVPMSHLSLVWKASSPDA